MLMRIRLWHKKSGRVHCPAPESGFSLLELSIALLILGMIAVPFMALQHAKIEEAYIDDTGSINARAANAINQFYLASGGRYPCPASLIAAEGEDEFGLEGTCTNLPAIHLCSSASWRNTTGYCKTDNTANAVIIGAFPFKSIGAPPESALDVWGNKILYAVTHQKTDSATFPTHNGAITVMAYVDHDTNAATAPVPGTFKNEVDFILVSTGKAGYGAYTKDGIAGAACRPLSSGLENENCDYDNVFFNDNNTDLSEVGGSRSFNEGASYFDDITFYQESVPTNLWFIHPLDVSRLITMASGVRVGEDPAISQERPQDSLDVRGGDMRANGDIKSDAICPSSATNCLDPITITGDPAEIPQMQCDYNNTYAGNQAVVQIAESSVICSGSSQDADSTPTSSGYRRIGLTAMQADGVTPVFRTRDCDSGYLVRGFTSTGDPICVIP